MSDVRPVGPLDVELALGFTEKDIDRTGREHVVELIQRLAVTAKAACERLARVEVCDTGRKHLVWQDALRALGQP